MHSSDRLCLPAPTPTIGTRADRLVESTLEGDPTLDHQPTHQRLGIRIQSDRCPHIDSMASNQMELCYHAR